MDLVIKRIGARFVYWYNIKYQRVGHLFQDRFKSEPVETDKYLLAVIRYIHQNPIKAGICKKAEDYKYSSYNEYTTASLIVDTEFILSLMSVDEFVKYNNEIDEAKCLDIKSNIRIRVTDEQASEIIEKVSKCNNTCDFQKLPVEFKIKCVKSFYDKGISIDYAAKAKVWSKSG